MKIFVFAPTEIDIPPEFTLCYQDEDGLFHQIYPPKPKVKKWKWEMHDKENFGNDEIPYTMILDGYYTEEEMLRNSFVISPEGWHKVEGSEIEVEE